MVRMAANKIKIYLRWQKSSVFNLRKAYCFSWIQHESPTDLGSNNPWHSSVTIIWTTHLLMIVVLQGAMCSDKNTPCCQNCQYMKAAVKCREAQYATCEKESRCNGISAECPKSPPMDDSTPCLEKGQCKDGKCVPYCETKGQLSCMCDDCKLRLYFIIIIIRYIR